VLPKPELHAGPAAASGVVPEGLPAGKERHMLQKLRNLVRRDDGASMVEYTILLGLVLAVTVAVMGAIGGNAKEIFGLVNDGLAGAVDDAGGTSVATPE
jgi:Flp pilus assembly pilin Flp